MAKGSLQHYDAGEGLRALLYRFVDLPAARLGGLHGSSEYGVVIEPPLNIQPSKVLLEVGIIVKDLKLPKWRLWVNSVAVTREFKPTLTAQLNDVDAYYAKVAYDLKPIVASTKPPYRIVIQYEGSPELELNDISLTALYPDEDSLTSYRYYSGALLLAPGDSISIDLPPGIDQGNASVIIRIPNRAARIKLSCGNEIVVTGIVGPYEARVNCSASKLDIVYEASKGINYFPRTAIVSSILFEKSIKREPDFAIKLAADETRKVIVRNIGTASPETLMLIAMRPGEVVERIILEPLGPGAETTLNIKNIEAATTLRIIWRFKGETRFKEFKLRDLTREG